MGNCSSTSNCNPCGPDFNAINQLATKAGAYARQANTYAVDAQNAFLEFNALYLGAFAVAPAVDNEGNPLQVGALYWNTGSNTIFAWDGTVWVENGNFNEFTPFLATGTTTARNLVTREADVVNVKDFGAVGDGIADDTDEIQAAIDAAELKESSVFIPSGKYKTTKPLVVNKPILIIGEGFGDAFTANPNNLGSSIIGDHLYGPILRIKSSCVCLKNFCVTSTSNRKSAPYVVGSTYSSLSLTRDDQNYGIWFEQDDVSGLIPIDQIFIENVWSYKQPSGGILIIAGGYISQISKCGVNNDYTNGHGFIIDNGDFTGRINKTPAGVLSIIDCASYKMGGNALIVGTPFIAVGAPTLRILVDNFDSYNNATTPFTRIVDYNCFFYSDNSVIQNSAFQSGNRTVGGLYVGGRNIKLTNNRFINNSQPIYVKSPIGAGTRTTNAIDIDSVWTVIIDNPSVLYNELVKVDPSSTGVRVYVGTTESTFTNLTDNKVMESQRVNQRFWEGNLIFGKTVNDDNTLGARINSDSNGGLISISRDSNIPLILNRDTDEGTMVLFRNNGANTASIYSGTGTPNGYISAAVGSLYLRLDGGAGNSLYVKETGTGNTGWVNK
jgi:hypothetical protein